MEVPAKRMKITTDIWDYVLEFMTDHPEMVTGKFMGPSGKQRLADLWKELSAKLNALGCGIKTASKWQKSFSDWKYHVKQKYAEIKTQRSKTGGGPAFHKTLTIQEERLLGLVGISCMEGDGAVQEIGLSQQASTQSVHVEAGPSTSQQAVLIEPLESFSPELEEIIIIGSPSVSQPPPGGDVLESSRTPTPRPSFRRRQGDATTLEQFQAETMEVLQSINGHLNTMSESLGVMFRPSGLSAIYLLILFYLPFVPLPTEKTMSGHTGIFLKILIAISSLTTLGQIAFQIVLIAMPPYAEFLEDDATLEKILRHAGFVSMDYMDPATVVVWLSPEIVMLAISVSFFIIMKKITAPTIVENLNEQGENTTATNIQSPSKSDTKQHSYLMALGKLIVLSCLCSAAVLRPSVIGGLYFIVFLASATWWACCKQLSRGFAIVLRCLMPIVFLHLNALFAYQFQWPQELLPKNSSYARYFGLTELMIVDSADERMFVYTHEEWPSYVNPIALYLLYYVMAFKSKALLQPKSQKKQGPFSRLEGSFSGQLGRQMSQRLSRRQLMRSATTKKRWRSATRKVRAEKKREYPLGEATPLIQGMNASVRYGSGRKSGMYQDSTGSVTITGGNIEDIPLDELGENTDYEPSLCDNIIYALESVLQLIIRSSYIGTNIIMMAWSITYLSWITFVLLIWANLIWLIPNQRKSMLFSSPLLVLYAKFLLLSAYLYSMNLTDEELPTSVNGVKLEEIGFAKIRVLPCLPLYVKCLYTIMFWITLRQYMQERMEEKQSNALADMVAPLQVTVGAAAGVNKEQETTKGSKVMAKIGQCILKLLTKFWIWIVAITLFAVAITGQRMTGFRIIYMALFLFFILSFQFSFRVWRKMMFVFWLVVIVYSMIILVMVYTYQFENFELYWKNLGVPKEQQLDIGLERFETKQLFVRLVTPTFFVIITVIQLHYFHKDFMQLSDPKNTNILNDVNNDDLDQSSLQGGALLERSEIDTTTSSVKFDLYELGHASNVQLHQVVRVWLNKLNHIKNLVYRFLEIHMSKIVLLFAMLVCVYDSCAIHFGVIVLISLSLTLGRTVRIFCIYVSSLLLSILLLARMIYQIKYITPENWNVTCKTGNETYIANNAHWLGFDKTTEVSRLVKWNVAYILVVTLWSVILIRQYYYRLSRGKPTTRAYFMFPNITRVDADKNIRCCLKYLANYGFYKFGFEISMMCTVALIGIRMDVHAMIHSIWLIVLLTLNRSVLARVWVFYLLYIAISLPVQYFMAIGLPPSLCQEFPWDSTNMLRYLQDWAYLLDKYNPPPPKKLLCDYFLLLLVSRQWVVFRIEMRYAGRNYAGGSNDNIFLKAEEKGFVNPVPDFVTYVRSYLDIFKNCILSSFLWITLAIVFLAGTNRVNIFSIGYLIGAFVFLWHGSDFYLRPIPNIIRQWQWLIGYNVTVIFLKTSFQILGCILISEIPPNCCWLVQLLGIGCVRKFGKLNLLDEDSDAKICKVPKEFIGIVWDGICFGLLIMQRRLFRSYNFFHIVNETKATTILASRGAELIEELRTKTMLEQEETERKVLEKIRQKMERIKANQQKLQAISYKDRSQLGPERPPLVRSTSVSSCTSATSQQSTPAGYHTPIDEEEPAPVTPRSSLIQPQAPPSPYSAVMTVSLEGYLEPQRMSFSSPPNSELNPRPVSPDDSFPVFSPPPYDEAPPYVEAVSEPPTIIQRRQSSIGPPWMQGSFVTPRQSIISYSSRSPLSHHEYSFFRSQYRRKPPVTNKQAVRSGDYYMFDDFEDDEIDLLPEEKSVKKETGGKPDITELLSTALKTDVGTAVRRHSQLGLKRQYSMPLSRQKSTKSQLSAAFSAPPTIEEHEPRSVRIQELPEDDDDDDEPQPGTSKDEDISDLTESESTIRAKIANGLLFIWAFIESVMISLTNFLNRYSRDYRYVIKVLAKEKKILKEETNYSEGLRLGSSQVWQPAGTYQTLLRQANGGSPEFSMSTTGIFSPSDSYRITLVAERMSSMQNTESEEKLQNCEENHTKTSATALPYSSDQERETSSIAPRESVTELSSKDQPTIVKLLLSIWYIVMSRSEVLCYFVIFLNQIKTATFMSLPLPIMVFFWGSLTIPRPSKTFWVTIIAYTEVIVLIKCVFQFDIMPGNNNRFHSGFAGNPFYPPRMVGTYRQSNYALWDLLLLLVVFFHRVLLKSMGIWSTTPVAAAMITSGSYKVEHGELIPIRSSSQDSDSDKEITPSSSKIISIETTEVDPSSHMPQALRLAAAKYGESIKKFFRQLLDPTSRVAVDVYSLMFLCDFFNFFVILIGYSSFDSHHDGGVSSYIADNRVPPLFLFMLILQFMLIVIDRGIYLRKNILGKIIFQFIQILLLHIWLFILFPIITGSLFNSVLPPQMYYMVKCFYLLLSAFQIRCGYPTRILGNFLCKGYGILNMILFKVFMFIPFLFELRTVMDWMWTETSMTLFDWFKMEDAYAHIYQLKCSRNMEEEFPAPRGQKKAPFIKYFMGSILLTIIIGLIWFPLVFFSLGNAVGEANIPYDVTLEIRIGPYEPVYKMSAQSNSISVFKESELNKFKTFYEQYKSAETFLSNYEHVDIAAVKLSLDSANIWGISPPDRQRMVEEINSTSDLKVRLEYKVSHKTSNPEDSGVIPGSVEIVIPPGTKRKPSEVRENLLAMLAGNGTKSVTLFKYILPKFLKVTNRGTATVVDVLMLPDPVQEAKSYRNITLNLLRFNNEEWWQVHEVCNDTNFDKFLSGLPFQNCDNSTTLYTFNDRIFPSTLSFFTAGGIIGLYTTLVFVASRVSKGIFAGQCPKIMFEDMPNVDRVLQLCLDIYLVRELHEFTLEEDLFAKLIFLFRSPETLIKWTRPKEEVGDDDDPEAEGQ